MLNKIKKVIWVAGLVLCGLYVLLQFELIAFHQLVDLEYNYLYGQPTITIEYKHQESMDVNKIVDAVYQLESSSGKNDSCLKKGLVNGYGYRQNTNSMKCYDNKQEVKAIVTNWFQTKLESGLTIAEAMCLYNTGKQMKNCTYYQNYLKISNG